MKGKRIFLSVIIAAVLFVTVALAVAATDTVEYTGTVDSAVHQLGTVDSKATVVEKIAVLDKILEYSATVDPTSEGYTDFIASFDAKKLEVARIALDEVNAKTAPADKESSLSVLQGFLANHEIVDLTEGDQNVFVAYEAAKTDIAVKYLEEASAEGLSAKERHAVLDALDKYRTVYTPALSEEFSTQLAAVNLTCANQYYGIIDTLESNAERGAIIRQISLFIKEHPFDTAEGYDSFLNIYNAAKSEYLAAMEEAKATLNKNNYFADLDKPALGNHDFTPSDAVTNPNNKTGALLAVGNVVSNQTVSFIDKDFGMDGDNGYYTVRYDVLNKQMGAEIKVANINSSAVFEFDITTFGELPISNKGLITVNSGAFTANGASWTPYYISITAEGNIVEGTSYDKVLLENAVVKGEWTHISIVTNFETCMAEVYVDYCLVYTVSLAHTSKGYQAAPTKFSILATATVEGGQFNLDNVKLYQGHAPRDLDFVTNATDDDRFIYYASAIDNEAISLHARKTFYDNAARQVENYWDGNAYKTENEDIIAAVNKVILFATAPDDNTPSPYQQLLKDLSDYNLSEIEKMVTKVTSFTRQESTQSDRTYFLGLADNLLASMGSYITDAQALGALSAALNEVRSNLSEEALLNDFVAAVDDFYAAASIENMQDAYERAKDVYSAVDPILATSAFPKFKNAYDKFEDMEDILYDKIIIENSKRLLACITFISTYAPDTWEAEYDYLISYVIMARDIIDSELYDPYYKNAAELVVNFAPMSEFFMARMQEKFIEHIEDELDRAKNSDKYFEKLGICIKLDEYIIENGLDGASEYLDSLISEVRSLLAELKGSREEYEALLKENTLIFVEMCEGLVGSIDYATMKRICDAAADYYYTMDVSDASAQDAISIYVARCNEINAVEAHAESFKMEVSLISVADTDVLAGIVASSKYLDKLDRQVEGVDEAIARLNSICEAYDNGIASANGELYKTFSYAVYTANTSKTTAALATLIFSKVN